MPELVGRELADFYNPFMDYLEALYVNQFEVISESYTKYQAAKERLKLACSRADPHFLRGEEEAEAKFMRDLKDSQGLVLGEYMVISSMPRRRTRLKVRGTTGKTFSAFSGGQLQIRVGRAHLVGELAATPCQSCLRGRGPFMDCIVVPVAPTSARGRPT